MLLIVLFLFSPSAVPSLSLVANYVSTSASTCYFVISPFPSPSIATPLCIATNSLSVVSSSSSRQSLSHFSFFR